MIKGIKRLKKNKAPGPDGIPNEIIKAGQYELATILTKIFNVIMLSGQFPDSWATSLIKPLFKGGSPHKPSDYRGISLSSCMGKLFCSVLNQRLVDYMNSNNIYKANQIAFREGSRTSDHTFVLGTNIN